MKKIVLTITILLVSICSYAQPVPPPSGFGQNGNQQPGGGAPIDGGLCIMLVLGATYGAKKYFGILNKNKIN
jgi:hypothetical protein